MSFSGSKDVPGAPAQSTGHNVVTAPVGENKVTAYPVTMAGQATMRGDRHGGLSRRHRTAYGRNLDELLRFAFMPLAIAVYLIAGQAMAGGKEAFSQVAFEAAERAGGPILVDVAASSVPDLQGASADFDQRVRAEIQEFTGVRARFRQSERCAAPVRRTAPQQSTLIVFNGATEVGRSVGDTGKASIEALLAKGL